MSKVQKVYGDSFLLIIELEWCMTEKIIMFSTAKGQKGGNAKSGEPRELPMRCCADNSGDFGQFAVKPVGCS